MHAYGRILNMFMSEDVSCSIPFCLHVCMPQEINIPAPSPQAGVLIVQVVVGSEQ